MKQANKYWRWLAMARATQQRWPHTRRQGGAVGACNAGFASQRANHLGVRQDCLGPDHLTSVTA